MSRVDRAPRGEEVAQSAFEPKALWSAAALRRFVLLAPRTRGQGDPW